MIPVGLSGITKAAVATSSWAFREGGDALWGNAQGSRNCGLDGVTAVIGVI